MTRFFILKNLTLVFFFKKELQRSEGPSLLQPLKSKAMLALTFWNSFKKKNTKVTFYAIGIVEKSKNMENDSSYPLNIQAASLCQAQLTLSYYLDHNLKCCVKVFLAVKSQVVDESNSQHQPSRPHFKPYSATHSHAGDASIRSLHIFNLVTKEW